VRWQGSLRDIERGAADLQLLVAKRKQAAAVSMQVLRICPHWAHAQEAEAGFCEEESMTEFDIARCVQGCLMGARAWCAARCCDNQGPLAKQWRMKHTSILAKGQEAGR
jgi:hypothetical protein